MSKKVVSILLVLAMAVLLVACGGQKESGKTVEADKTVESGKTGDTEQAAETNDGTEAKEMADLVISGVVGSPGSDMTAHEEIFKKAYPNVNVDFITCDAVTREQILKTAISAGDPPTVGFYWGTRLKAFSDIGMCLDLRDHFDQDYFDKINSGMQGVNLGPNNEQFGISFTAVYHTTFYNKDMFDKYGFSIPKTWDDFTEIFATLKKDNIFGFATNSAAMQDCLYGIVYAELEDQVGPGTSMGVADATVSVAPGSPAGEVIRNAIEQVRAWYDAGYWYPGDGGINTTADDANAAFAQGRCMFIFNFSGAYATHENSCDFEVGTFLKPTSKEGMPRYEHIEPSVYFIPANASEAQINTATEFFKIVLSQEGQQAIVNSNNLPAVTGYSYEGISPILQQMMDTLEVDTNNFAPLNPTRTSSEMQTFIKQEIFAAPLSGAMTVDETLNKMEKIRIEASKK
jgi:ABC-type glycerol-3-phosphate transport system substrate-binding protein